MSRLTLENALLIPAFGHLALIVFLFVIVSYKRLLANKRDEFDLNTLAMNGGEPELSRRWAKNLDNQFQIPMLFYVLIVLLFTTNLVSLTQIVLAWVFLFGRIVHTIVQTSSDNVVLRGRVFVINFVALGLMWLLFLANRFGTL